MDSHLIVTPAIFKPGSTVLKASGFPARFREWRGRTQREGELFSAIARDHSRY